MSDLISSDDPFDAGDKQALQAVLAYMIPADEERPGADDPLIMADILTTARSSADLVKAALAIYRSTDLVTLSQTRTPEVNALVSLAVQCYYRDDRVMASLEMEPRAPHPQGYEIPEGDWQLLEPVRQRGRHYRDVP
ncbi:MAG: hypothetical protein NXH95_07170 [Pseudomonadaceae bacterium]|nr:hypothetical protein [Pseudomonadaceae bacterium]